MRNNTFISALLLYFLLNNHFTYGQKPYFVNGDYYPNAGKYAYQDSLRTITPDFRYSDVKEFRCGLAFVYTWNTETSTGGWGVIDSAGNTLVPPIYEKSSAFYDGVAIVKMKEKYGFIDRTGKVVIKIKYDEVNGFSENKALVRLKGKWKIIDKSGEELTALNESYTETGYFYEGRCVVKNEAGLKGYIDENGDEVISCKYFAAFRFKNGKAEVWYRENPLFIDTKAGYIDKSGNILIPFKYNTIEEFKNGFARVSNQSNDSGLPKFKYGYISETGKEIVPAEYDVLEVLFNKWVKGWKQYMDQSDLYDLEGNRISSDNFNINCFREDYCIVDLNDKKGVYSIDGKELLPVKYDTIAPIHCGLALFKESGKWGYFNQQFQIQFSPVFDEAQSFANDTAIVVQEGKKYFLKPNGEKTDFKIDSSRFYYEQFQSLKFGKNLKGKWHVALLNDQKVSLFFDNITNVDGTLWIGYKDQSQTLFLLDEKGSRKVDIPDAVSKNVVTYFGYGYFGHPQAVIKENGKYGLYHSGHQAVVPAGFTDYRIDGASCDFLLDQAWYNVVISNSDFYRGIYEFYYKCDACNGIGGTLASSKKIKIEGESHWVPPTFVLVKDFEYVTLPNGEKSMFITRDLSYYEKVPGYWKKDPDTYKTEYIPSVKCNICFGDGYHTKKMKWNGTAYLPL